MLIQVAPSEQLLRGTPLTSEQNLNWMDISAALSWKRRTVSARINLKAQVRYDTYSSGIQTNGWTELPPLPPIPSSLSSSTKEPPPRQRVKSMKRTTTPLPDGRFLVLQRKLEELERLHQDSKKAVRHTLSLPTSAER